jgi:hypothetical protein
VYHVWSNLFQGFGLSSGVKNSIKNKTLRFGDRNASFITLKIRLKSTYLRPVVVDILSLRANHIIWIGTINDPLMWWSDCF